MANYKDIKYDFSGENLTALNATQLTSGTTPDARYTTLPAVSGANLTSLTATNLSSGTVPTARLGTGTASSSTILYGDNTWAAAAAAGGFTNAWAVQCGAQNFTQNVATLMTLDAETYDPDGVFDNSAGNYKWTCPDDGTYFFYMYAVYYTMASHLGLGDATLTAYINGAWNGLGHRTWSVVGGADVLYAVDLEGTFMRAFTAGDYVQYYAALYVAGESGETGKTPGNYNQFGGWRMDS